MSRVSPDTAARYHRKIISGERTGSDIWKRATEPVEKGLYQAQWIDPATGKHYSVNLSVANAKSTFDIVAIEAEMRAQPATIAQIVDRFRLRYGDEAAHLQASKFSIRQIAKQRRDPIRIII